MGFGIIGTQLNDGNIGIEIKSLTPCLLLHIRMVTLVEHGTGADAIILHMIAFAKQILHLGRIAKLRAHINTRTVGDAITDTSYTDGIAAMTGQLVEP